MKLLIFRMIDTTTEEYSPVFLPKIAKMKVPKNIVKTSIILYFSILSFLVLFFFINTPLFTL